MTTGDAREVRGPAKERLLGELVPMPEATLLAHIAASGMDVTITRYHRNEMAQTLARLLTVFAVLPDGTVLQLTPPDLRGGSFRQSGATLHYEDGRPPLTGLAVRRTALKAAVAALKDAHR